MAHVPKRQGLLPKQGAILPHRGFLYKYIDCPFSLKSGLHEIA
jgi:hypothetical protein